LTAASIILTLVTLQRLGELSLARHNTTRLVAQGARETAPKHYPAMIGVHASWLLGLWWFGWSGSVHWGWLIMFAALQLLRAWIIASLGPRWTTRIITLPSRPLVRRGPYRFLNHPNYAVVVGEIAILPLVFGLASFAFVFSILNALVLFVRLRAENRALAEAAYAP
jgi:methyltransferase